MVDRYQIPEPLSDQIDGGDGTLLVKGTDGKYRTFFRVESDDDREPARVYFLRDGGCIKIGTSTNVYARVSSGQTMNPRELVLIGSVPGDQRLEADLHRRFDSLRVRGEWFVATAELLAFIDGLLTAASR
jgi:Meiotically up-regulated gene 113